MFLATNYVRDYLTFDLSLNTPYRSCIRTWNPNFYNIFELVHSNVCNALCLVSIVTIKDVASVETDVEQMNK